jgi:ankyrin repeat protein
LFKLFLETGKTDKASKDIHGRGLVSYAAAKGHEAVVKLLLEANADIEAEDSSHSQTPLSWAIANGHAAVATLLQSFRSV